MNVQELIELLQAEVVAGTSNITNEISGGYASDLLSNVMSQAQLGNVWITMQAHRNIVAVASLLKLSVVIVAGKVVPDNETVTAANDEEMPLLITALSVFEVVGLLYSKGIKAT